MTRRVFLIVFLLNFYVNAQAWFFPAHVLITQVAMQKIKPSVANTISHLMVPLFDNSPKKLKSQLRQYPHVSLFARFSYVPDLWRKKTLKELFREYRATLPEALQPYAGQVTTTWHYINKSHNNACQLRGEMNVLKAITLMRKAYHESRPHSPARGLCLILLAHFVEDAHQPLHQFGQSTKRCSYDAGGNLFCLKPRENGRCPYSLHMLWDSALAFRINKKKITLLAKSLLAREQSQFSLAEIAEQNPSVWQKLIMPLAPFVYSTPQGRYPDKAYLHKGRRLALSLMVLSGLRLAYWLNHHVKRLEVHCRVHHCMNTEIFCHPMVSNYKTVLSV